MIDRNLEKLKYETSVHHRQNLRSQLDQNMINEIEISRTPSLNYQKAYQSLYYDELQKSVHLHDKKKQLEETKKAYDILVSREHQDIYTRISEREPFKNSVSAINIPNLNYRDVDYINYDLLKETKALDHTLRNYDGGQGFYKNSDAHMMNKQMELENMRKTLLKQVTRKQQEKQNQGRRKAQEQQALRQGQENEQLVRKEIQGRLIEQKLRHRDEMVSQIQEERIKRGRRSIFNYNSVARHNPITNPIEYHIDNPYILKQIQNKQQHH